MAKTITTPQRETAISSQPRRAKPNLFKVFMHNDDYTPMEFVVELLQSVFHKDRTVATLLMLQIHHRGQVLCGLYPFEIAETKVAKVHKQAREFGFPLRCTLEPE